MTENTRKSILAESIKDKEQRKYWQKLKQQNNFVDPKMMHRSLEYCRAHGGPKDCFGLLHNISFNLYDENGNELTDENIFTAKVHFKCRCDKCGFETMLSFDPDIPTILY